MSWTKPAGGDPLFTLEQALDIVRRKKAILDVDKVPSIDFDAALNDKAMGRSTPATEAVADAYRQFYEVNGSDQLAANTRAIQGAEAEIASLKAQAEQGGC